MSSIALFYQNTTLTPSFELQLEEETAKHIVQVLRMKEGTAIALTDGKGTRADAIIIKTDKKKCTVLIREVQLQSKAKYGLHLCVAFTKNTSRNEWLLEKATELGVSSITPMVSSRTEREKFREDRWQNIIVSALLQSQQYYLPQLNSPTILSELIKSQERITRKLIAHCIEDIPRIPISEALYAQENTAILIGPEGDFTREETLFCMENNYRGISLCEQRLRTETAAMTVCAYFNLINHEQ
jgi:16S rRNA (uracil1498-N3)-methyltransferase